MLMAQHDELVQLVQLCICVPWALVLLIDRSSQAITIKNWPVLYSWGRSIWIETSWILIACEPPAAVLPQDNSNPQLHLPAVRLYQVIMCHAALSSLGWRWCNARVWGVLSIKWWLLCLIIKQLSVTCDALNCQSSDSHPSPISHLPLNHYKHEQHTHLSCDFAS